MKIAPPFKTTLAAASFSIIFATASFAQSVADGPAPAPVDVDSSWSGSLSATVSVSTGNSSNTNVGLFGDAAKERGLYTHLLNGGYLYSEADGTTDQSKGYASYQLNRSFADGAFGLNDRFYGFGIVSGVYDEFGAYRDDYFAGAGLGYKAIDTAETKWTLDAAAGARYLGEPGSNIEPAARFASRFRTNVNERVTFSNDTSILWSPEDTLFVNDTALTAQLSDRLSARAGFRIDHHTNAPADSEPTDTLTYAGVTYGF
jgi:putative salt-induced outer membrane protein